MLVMAQSKTDKRTRWRIAAHIRRVMHEREWKAADVCRATGVAASNLSKLLAGEDDRIGLDFVLALHRGLHIDANVLLDHDPPHRFFLQGQLSGRPDEVPGHARRGQPSGHTGQDSGSDEETMLARPLSLPLPRKPESG